MCERIPSQIRIKDSTESSRKKLKVRCLYFHQVKGIITWILVERLLVLRNLIVAVDFQLDPK